MKFLILVLMMFAVSSPAYAGIKVKGVKLEKFKVLSVEAKTILVTQGKFKYRINRKMFNKINPKVDSYVYVTKRNAKKI